MEEHARILVVDDSAEVRRLLRKILEMEGYSVSEAADGREALQHLYDEEVHLVLLDAMMPNVNGWQVLKAIREDERIANIPVIICTAREIVPGESPGWEKADGAIHKPFRRSEVIGVVQEALSAGKARSTST
ncbi:MAG: two-component system response regulator [Acidimicrobiia bacterium]